jgi:nitroimidazol reductase NimA-like FMN-containing flavoprotein (pyridoxamine 5'-phosphate oxidase superfamily)
MPAAGTSNGLMDRETSMSLLATVPVGRIALSVDSLPVIVPVGFCVDGDRVVLAVPTADRLAERVNGAIVAFQADLFVDSAESGWSVLVQGPARLVDDPVDADRLRSQMMVGCGMSNGTGQVSDGPEAHRPGSGEVDASAPDAHESGTHESDAHESDTHELVAVATEVISGRRIGVDALPLRTAVASASSL